MFEMLITRPLLNVLFFFSAVIPGHDFGIAVILLTVFVRLILWPLAQKQLHSQKKLNAIQPEVNRLKKKYEKDPQKFNAAVMELYKEKETNPFSSCLPTPSTATNPFRIFLCIPKIWERRFSCHDPKRYFKRSLSVFGELGTRKNFHIKRINIQHQLLWDLRSCQAQHLAWGSRRSTSICTVEDDDAKTPRKRYCQCRLKTDALSLPNPHRVYSGVTSCSPPTLLGSHHAICSRTTVSSDA
jgi:hypothetical protein